LAEREFTFPLAPSLCGLLGVATETTEIPMDNINRVFFSLALIMTLVGTFALCAKAYDWAHRDQARATGVRVP
jgi:hypothetical protein